MKDNRVVLFEVEARKLDNKVFKCCFIDKAVKSECCQRTNIQSYFFAQLMISTKILLTLKTEIEGRQLQSNFTAHVQMNCNTSKFNECVGIFCGQHSSI